MSRSVVANQDHAPRLTHAQIYILRAPGDLLSFAAALLPPDHGQHANHIDAAPLRHRPGERRMSISCGSSCGRTSDGSNSWKDDVTKRLKILLDLTWPKSLNKGLVELVREVIQGPHAPELQGNGRE